MEITIISPLRFQHTAAEFGNVALVVLTHSRPKVAGFTRIGTRLMREVSTHSRLKAAELYGVLFILIGIVSTHSRLKAAGPAGISQPPAADGFNTQPPKGGWSPSQKPCSVRFHSPDFAKLPRKA